MTMTMIVCPIRDGLKIISPTTIPAHCTGGTGDISLSHALILRR